MAKSTTTSALTTAPWVKRTVEDHSALWIEPHWPLKATQDQTIAQAFERENVPSWLTVTSEEG